MALTKEIGGQASPIYTKLLHAYKTEAAGALTTFISGVAGKRIRIWRLFVTCAAADKSCALLSGTNPFTTLYDKQWYELKSSDGIPVFTCNVAEDFKFDSGDATAWYFHAVYSIE